MTELRTPDLRFTSDEAATFLNQVMDLDVSDDEVAALETRTEGWITGLQLAGLSVQGLHSDDLPGFIADFTGSHRYIFDYLADEVLQQQSEDIRNFLLQTSILNRLTGSLCNAVTGQDDGQETLERLEAANLFIVPLDTERHWYRYHHLFADLLRQRLQQLQPDTISELHRQASQWYEQNELITEALGHALAAADYERATQLVAANALLMLTRGQVSTVQDWLDALPSERIRTHPRLCIDQAWALYLTNRPSAVEPILVDAERGLQSGVLAEQPTTSGWLGEVMALRAWVKRSEGDLDQAIELSQKALEHLTEKQMFVRCMNILSLAGAWQDSGNPAQAVQALVDCIPKCMADGNPLGVMGGAYDLAQLQVIRGQLHQARKTLHDALLWATEQRVQRLPAAALLHVGLGVVLLEQNDLQAAEDHLETGLELLKQARGDTEGARDAFQNAEQAARNWEVPQTVAGLAAHRARLLLAQGDLAAAIQWRQKAGLRSDDDPTYLREVELITLARVLIVEARAQSDKSSLSDVLKLLERLQQTAETGERMGRVVEILVLRALALQAQDNVDGAIIVLERALVLAEPEGYVRLFVDEGTPMARLLYEAATRGIAPDYAGNLLAAFPDADSTHAQRLRSEGVEPLSQRELEVLQLIAEGLSNRELASRLSLSLNTVKAHTRNLYSKLDVNSRTQAVAKATALGILPSP
jgi:LuxR family maltose regulon positive regulatory protein